MVNVSLKEINKNYEKANKNKKWKYYDKNKYLYK